MVRSLDSAAAAVEPGPLQLGALAGREVPSAEVGIAGPHRMVPGAEGVEFGALQGLLGVPLSLYPHVS